MHGDFSRDSFDPKSNFARVLMQQGRLIVDADWNEQSAILLHYIRTLAADLIGWHGGAGVVLDANNKPTGGPLAVLKSDQGDTIRVASGHYYINGNLFDFSGTSFPKKDDIPQADWATKPEGANAVLLFADLFDGLVTHAQLESLTDPAFEGLDTTARVRSNIKLRGWWEKQETGSDPFATVAKNMDQSELLKLMQRPERLELPLLRAFTNFDSSNEDDCSVDPSSGYTGLENQLYRIEVHFAGKDGKTFWDGSNEEGNNRDTAFSLKWSRDNGSIVYAGMTTGDGVTLTTKWRDDSTAIHKGDYVELISGDNESGTLAEVTGVTEDDGQYTLMFDSTTGSKGEKVRVRRWDHRSRAKFPIATNSGFVVKARDATNITTATNITNSVDIPIEDGIMVQLQIPGDSQLQKGDYWLIPARAATGDIIWPPNEDKTGVESYDAVPCCYTQHHYAPIALIAQNGAITDLRRNIEGIAKT